MIRAMSGESARESRVLEHTRATGRRQWRTQYIGERTHAIGDMPQAFLAEMGPHGKIVPHFHEVDQFQVLISGSGALGRTAFTAIALHYADHHTAYGPIEADALGLSFFTIRARADSGPIYLHQPDYKTFLKPSKKRYVLAKDIALSTAPVLQDRSEAVLENLFHGESDVSDGLGAYMLRLGCNMNYDGPDPALTDGQYYLVVNGSIDYQSASYKPWSLIYIGPDDAPLQLHAGDDGVEVLVLNFPRTGN